MVCRLLLRRKLDGHVTRALADPRGAAESAGAVALERRTFVDVGLADDELVGDELMVVLRVGHCRLEKLEHIDGRRSWRVLKDGTRLVDRLAADVVDHESRLARSVAYVLGLRANDDRAVRCTRCRRLLVHRRLGGGGRLGRTAATALRLLLRLVLGGLLSLGLHLGSLLVLGGLRLRGLLGLFGLLATRPLGLGCLRLLLGSLLGDGLLRVGSLVSGVGGLGGAALHYALLL